MVATIIKPLLSEVLRPKNLADLTLPDDLIASFQRCVQRQSIPNMLFYGEPGIGKTSAARILIRELDADEIELNGSFHDGEKTFVRRVQGFASTMSMYGRPKICFIDEADYMSNMIQNSLRYEIERYSETTRFLLTANDETRLSAAMKSRCMPICFDIKSKDVDAVIERLVVRYEIKLAEAGYDIKLETIRKIVAIHFPDMRSIANNLQFEI